jgi:hypothetical protein
MEVRRVSIISHGAVSFPRRVAAIILFLLVVTVAVSPALSKDAETCLACHAEGSVAPPPKLDTMDRSVHGSLDCMVCHPGASTFPHEPKTLKMSCGTCHSSEQTAYDASIHGRARSAGEMEAATCVSCHGQPHAILPVDNPDSSVYHINLPRTCGQCHATGKLPSSLGMSVTNAFNLYSESIHGKAVMKSGLLVAANCANCHGAHDILRKSDPASRVNRANVPGTCGACHAGILREYTESSHFEALKAGAAKAPVCSDCHTAHAISQVESAQSVNQLIQQCSGCHASQFSTYRDTFHGKVTTLGNLGVARCASCHGAHRVLPTSDPRSPTSPALLTQTCQKCHPRATASFTQYRPHAEYKNKSKFPGLYAIYVAMTALLLGVFCFFGAHTVLWLVHSVRTREGRANPGRKEGDDAR